MTTQNAICLVGHLRNIEKTRPALRKLAETFDIFVVTNEQYRHYCKTEEWITEALIIEDHPELIAEQDHLCQRRGGQVFLQWQKLREGLNLVIQQERERGVEFGQIIKIRSDVPLQKVDFASSFPTTENALSSQSDVIFGGARETMMKFREFLNFATQSCYSNSEYRKIPWAVIAAWEPLAAAQHRLLLPLDAYMQNRTLVLFKLLFRLVTGPGHGLLGTQRLIRILYGSVLRKMWPVLDSFREGGPSVTVDVDDGENLFPSERSFATYCAMNGIEMLSIRPFIEPFRNRKRY